jgi:phosphoglycolate phosphatase
MPPTVVLDLDGTVLDERPRHYGCYAVIMSELEQPALPIDEYWALKRAAVDAQGVLSRTGSAGLRSAYERRWLSMIESPAMLALDSPHAGVIDTLRSWAARGASLVLTSLRQSAAGVDAQIGAHGLDPIFPRRAIALPAEKAQGKAAAVGRLLESDEVSRAVWIGDTEADVHAARLIGCAAWVVTCGIRSSDFLKSLQPDRMAASLVDFDPFEQTCGAK